jgi:hypothetical protein
MNGRDRGTELVVDLTNGVHRYHEDESDHVQKENDSADVNLSEPVRSRNPEMRLPPQKLPGDGASGIKTAFRT